MKQNTVLGWALTVLMVIFWAWVFGLLLHATLSLKDSYPLLAGLAGMTFIGLAAYLARLSMK